MQWGHGDTILCNKSQCHLRSWSCILGHYKHQRFPTIFFSWRKLVKGSYMQWVNNLFDPSPIWAFVPSKLVKYLHALTTSNLPTFLATFKSHYPNLFVNYFFVTIGPCSFVFQFSLKPNAIGDNFPPVVTDAPLFWEFGSYRCSRSVNIHHDTTFRSILKDDSIPSTSKARIYSCSNKKARL